jgi:hypothetical protein
MTVLTVSPMIMRSAATACYIQCCLVYSTYCILRTCVTTHKLCRYLSSYYGVAVELFIDKAAPRLAYISYWRFIVLLIFLHCACYACYACSTVHPPPKKKNALFTDRVSSENDNFCGFVLLCWCFLVGSSGGSCSLE